MSCGTTTSASHLAMCHMVPRPVPRTWQCVIWYHDQGISPGIMSYGTTTSVFHMAMCHTVTRSVQPSNMTYGTTTSVFHLAMCYAVQQPMFILNLLEILIFILPLLRRGAYCFTSVRPSVSLSFCPYKIFFVAFFSATIDGRNLIFGHKLHIGMPYCGKRLWTRQIPTSCLPT